MRISDWSSDVCSSDLKVELGCRHCGGSMKRTPEVADAWFDSGAMPYAQWHYPFENEATFDNRFPADFICEAVDQTRGWFYTLHALATLLNRPEDVPEGIDRQRVLQGKSVYVRVDHGGRGVIEYTPR